MSLDDATPEEWDAAAAVAKTRRYFAPRTVPEFEPKSEYGGPDVVNQPAHYNNGNIECIDYIQQQLGDDFAAYLEGNMIKYIHRWKYKNQIEDLRKARWYLERLIKEAL